MKRKFKGLNRFRIVERCTIRAQRLHGLIQFSFRSSWNFLEMFLEFNFVRKIRAKNIRNILS